MTNDKIIEIANEAKKTANNPSEWAVAFARIIQAETREEDANICMSLCSVIEEPHEFERCAAAIRSK